MWKSCWMCYTLCFLPLAPIHSFSFLLGLVPITTTCIVILEGSRLPNIKRRRKASLCTMLGCQPSVLTHWSMHHQKSSSDSPFQANTGTPEQHGGRKSHLKIPITKSNHYYYKKNNWHKYITVAGTKFFHNFYRRKIDLFSLVTERLNYLSSSKP